MIASYFNCITNGYCGSERMKKLAEKLAGYIDKFKRQAQQLGSLRGNIHSLGDAFREA